MGGILTTGCEPPIPWIGGKTILLPVIKRIIPERKNKFLDVFGGGGSVSLSGKYAPLQIYNDYNPHLANFMRILKSRSEELIDKLTGAYNSDGTLNENFERTFFINSRDSFNACSNVFHKGDTWEKLFDANLKIQLKAASLAEKEHAWSIVLDAWRLYKERENDPELIDAVLFFYLMKCSYSATGTSWACKAVNRESMVRLINEASRMMQGITVENKDCIELIKLHDDPSTFVYCDPPYYMAEALYNGVPLFGDAKHIELHDTLLECKSDVLLSYNECPFIDELYSESKWYKMRLSRPHSMVLHKGSGAVYNEFLIANYDIYKLYNRQPVYVQRTERIYRRICKLVQAGHSYLPHSFPADNNIIPRTADLSRPPDTGGRYMLIG